MITILCVVISLNWQLHFFKKYFYGTFFRAKILLSKTMHIALRKLWVLFLLEVYLWKNAKELS